MYFRIYGPTRTWLDQCLKSLVSEDPSKSNMVNGPKYVEISMKAPLPYLLINVKAIDLEKVSLRQMKCKILRLFFNILISDSKYSLLNTDKLTQPIQMELSQQEKSFSTFF